MTTVIDVGNTCTVAARVEGRRVLMKARVGTGALLKDASKIIPVIGRLKGKSKKCLVCSVVDELNGPLKKAIKAVGLDALLLAKDVEIPVKNRAKQPEKVGADRLVNCLAAKKLGLAPAVVIDFGTATTFDIVGGDGGFDGGIICPGIDAGASYLYEKTSRLPRISFRKPRRLIGRDTVGAMTSGVFYGALGGVEKIVALLKNELHGRFRIIATGGKARLALGSLSFKAEFIEDLTLVGISYCGEED